VNGYILGRLGGRLVRHEHLNGSILLANLQPRQWVWGDWQQMAEGLVEPQPAALGVHTPEIASSRPLTRRTNPTTEPTSKGCITPAGTSALAATTRQPTLLGCIQGLSARASQD
jgi:hypothetical protein